MSERRPPNGITDRYGMLTCDRCQRIAPPDQLADFCERRGEWLCELDYYAERLAAPEQTP